MIISPLTKPLKIIIFDGSFNTTPFINRLVKGLSTRHKVYILGFNIELPSKLEGVHYISLGSNQQKIRFIATTLKYAFQSLSPQHFTQTMLLLMYGERQKLQQQNLKFILNKIHPDIIHLQWPSLLPWFEEVLRDQKTPIVLSQRGTQNNVRPFINEEAMEYLREWYPKISGFHSVSHSITTRGNKIWNSSKKVGKVIYTGLPFEEIKFSEHYKRNNSLQLLSVGRAHWIKGYNYALRTCKILKERNVDFHYTIIGGAGNEELQFLVEDLGLGEDITLQERLPQTTIFKLMQNASLLLLSSVEEGIPNVVVEAMAIGLPVLSTDCGGISELINNSVEGWLVPIRNPEAMAEGVIDFLNQSDKQIEKIRIAARKKVELQHSEESMVRGMEEFYETVLDEKRITPAS